METSKSNTLKLGIFVSSAIILFIVGIYFIGKQQQLFSNTFHLSGIFTDISGLEVGNNVRFSGINVGIVENIEQVTDSTVKVEMLIDKDNQRFIKQDASAIIGSDGLMGNKVVLITPGNKSTIVIADHGTVKTGSQVSMDDILLKLKLTTDNAATITSDLAAIIGNIRSGQGTIGKLFMDSAFAKTVDDALINIKQGAGGFKQNMDAAKSNFLLKGYYDKKKKETDKAKTK